MQKHIFIFFFALVFALFFQNMQIYVNMKAIFSVMNTTWAVVKILSAVQIYDFHIFTVVYSPLHGFNWNQHNNQFLVGLLAQLVERCTGIAEVMGSNPVQAWIFFRPYFHYCSSSVHYCEDRFHIHVFIRSSNMWLSYIHCLLCKSILYTKEGNTMWHIIIL